MYEQKCTCFIKKKIPWADKKGRNILSKEDSKKEGFIGNISRCILNYQ